MTIRPVDLQVVLPHATDVGRAQAIQNDQSVVSQQLFAEKLLKEAQEKRGQVQETQRSEFGKIKRDKEKERKKKNKSNDAVFSKHTAIKETKGKSIDKKGSLDPVLGKNLDISS